MCTKSLRQHNITLQGERIVLRPTTEDDWDVLAQWHRDPEVLWFSEGDDVQSRSLADVQEIYRCVSQSAFCFIIELDALPIGECWLQEMNLDRILARYADLDCRRIDIMIGAKHLWGQGYGTEAIRLLTRLGFELENADLIFGCGVADYNPRSRGAFEKVGFVVDQWVENPPGAKARCECDLVLSRDDYLRPE